MSMFLSHTDKNGQQDNGTPKSVLIGRKSLKVITHCLKVVGFIDGYVVVSLCAMRKTIEWFVFEKFAENHPKRRNVFAYSLMISPTIVRGPKGVAEFMGWMGTKHEAMRSAALEFVNGGSADEVMKKYDICLSSIYNAIKRFNIPYSGRTNRTIFFDEDYFSIIDSEDKAYWLGIIMSDGNINRSDSKVTRPNRLVLNAVEQDAFHLEAFMSAINYTGDFIIQSQLKSYSPTPIYYLYCNSIRMCDDLIRIGCFPQKTGRSHLPLLPKKLIRHFIRGYFDGDGAISQVRRVIKRPNGKVYEYPGGEFSITSDESMLQEIQTVLMSDCNLPITKLKTYKRTTKAVSLRYGGINELRRIFNYLYENATVYLPRKYEKFTLLLSR